MSIRGTEKTKNLEANIVILGSGGGGLAAAVAAAEEGATGIIVLEKLRHLGGNSARARGLFACESPVQKREMIDCSADDCFKIAMKWAHWSRVDPLIVRAYLNKSGDTIQWLEGKGLEFQLVKLYPNQVPVWHVPKGFGGRLIKVLSKNCEDKGVKLFLRTHVKKILRGAKGSITGVLAANEEGDEFEIKARSVVIATGGFAGNKEMMRKYCPDYYDSMRLVGAHHTGDGMLMAAEAGAAIAGSVPLLKGGPEPDMNWANVGYLRGIVREPYVVWVNKRGKRFIDETEGFMSFESINAALLQPDKVTYTLFDDQIRHDMEEEGLIVDWPRSKHEFIGKRGLPGLKEELQQKVNETKGNLLKISDSWDEIARWIGANPGTLKTTIDEYNSFCDRGHDEVFVKDRRYLLPLRRAPYYAVKCCTGFHDTLGGIKVNENMEVKDTEDNIIPGLYAAGVLTDGFVSDTYCNALAGSAVGFAVNSGRIAGENAAAYVSRNG